MQPYSEQIMNRVLVLLALSSGACSSSVQAPNAGDTSQRVVVEEPLRLTISDFATSPGILFVRPNAAVSPSLVTVRSTRYGSLCRYDVSGHASVQSAVINLRIVYTERLTLCTQEIRAISYAAEVKATSGTYDLVVLHEENAKADTVLHE